MEVLGCFDPQLWALWLGFMAIVLGMILVTIKGWNRKP